jgi:hypothetical protein
LPDPRISAGTDGFRSDREHHLNNGRMQMGASCPIDRSRRKCLQKLQQWLRVFDRAWTVEDNDPVFVAAYAHGKISFRLSTRRTRPSPMSVVPE